MKISAYLNSALLGCTCAIALTAIAYARDFNIPSGDLESALNAYTAATGVDLIVASDAIKGVRTKGATGALSADDALSRLLVGTGFRAQRQSSGAIAIVHGMTSSVEDVAMQLAQATPAPRTAVETVTVTSSKLGGADVQSIPIAITALSQEQLTATQTAGGPDLVKQVPNLTFSKTNFTGYNIQIRGIGTQAISVTTDPAVAVALNDIPFIRNHFFEQEFYDLGQAEVLRGPQGTLYGRNATAGVVNLITAKPTDQFEAMASGELGNYHQRRFEGMINLPIVDDRVDLRIAGEWTKRQGYSFNAITDQRIDGRDLWSGRVSLAFNPSENLKTTLVWEHFSEDDDRLRSGKQLCKTDQPPTSVNGVPVAPGSLDLSGAFNLGGDYLSQGCKDTSLYSPAAFQVPYGFSLPYAVALGTTNAANVDVNPYASTTQSTNLRVIESTLNPHYQAKNDTLELNADYKITPALTFTSQTGYNQDFLSSAEDYNRFNTSPGIFAPTCVGASCVLSVHEGDPRGSVSSDGTFCDPQMGCSSRIVAEDLSNEHAWQLSQEFRLASDFSGPLNFSLGGNFLHYETEENYYVFINSLTLFSVATGFNGNGSLGPPYVPGVTDNHECLSGGANGYQNPNPILGGGEPTSTCIYIDPNPIGNLNNKGHNYFLSQNPYVLNSYAGFGEAYYTIAPDLKLTTGLRWTIDQKHFTDIPSEVITQGYGYPVTGIVNQSWDRLTGRAALNWTPKLDFTDQTLVYASYAHGYKAGGANPPGAVLPQFAADATNFDGEIAEPIHPLTFKPEYIEAFELGTKNTALDGSLTVNGDIFYYNYLNYQISEIVDRTAINNNYNAHVEGAELETNWEPLSGLKFSFAGGFENTGLAGGDQGIDLMDRTAGMPGWMVVKPFVTDTSNCILPTYVVQALIEEENGPKSPDTDQGGGAGPFSCGDAYINHLDPVTELPYVPNPTISCSNCLLDAQPYAPPPAGYIGFNPATAPNNGEGFDKKLGGNQLPNAPPFTVSFGAQYTLPITPTWAGTLRGDYYWQDYSWARVFNDDPYDRLRGYTNVNLTLIFTNQNGWQVMGYLKNVFNTTAITGDFLNSDDSGLTTNVFLTDPRLIGIRVTKNW